MDVLAKALCRVWRDGLGGGTGSTGGDICSVVDLQVLAEDGRGASGPPLAA